MRTIEANWYEYPHLYDIAFGWDPDVEVDFLEACWNRFGEGATSRIYEPFCGTGRIAIELARRGYTVTGLDLVPGAIEYARGQTPDEGTGLTWQVGDVTQWCPPESVDAIPILIDSFRHLHQPGAAERAIEQFGAALRPGGILILGVDAGAAPVEVTDEESWTMSSGEVTIETSVFDTRQPGPVPDSTIVRAVLAVDGDGAPYSVITDDVMRCYTRDGFVEMVTSNGPFELCGVFDRRYDLDQTKHENSNERDMVAVFRRHS